MRVFWDRLVGVQREVEATSWGGLLLGNVWPAYLFALPLSARIIVLAQTTRPDTVPAQAQLLQAVVTIVFLGLVVVLFAIRRRSIKGQRATWLAGGVALFGTFLLNAVAYLPIEDSTSTESLLAASVVV